MINIAGPPTYSQELLSVASDWLTLSDLCVIYLLFQYGSLTFLSVSLYLSDWMYDNVFPIFYLTEANSLTSTPEFILMPSSDISCPWHMGHCLYRLREKMTTETVEGGRKLLLLLHVCEGWQWILSSSLQCESCIFTVYHSWVLAKIMIWAECPHSFFSEHFFSIVPKEERKGAASFFQCAWPFLCGRSEHFSFSGDQSYIRNLSPW